MRSTQISTKDVHRNHRNASHHHLCHVNRTVIVDTRDPTSSFNSTHVKSGSRQRCVLRRTQNAPWRDARSRWKSERPHSRNMPMRTRLARTNLAADLRASATLTIRSTVSSRTIVGAGLHLTHPPASEARQARIWGHGRTTWAQCIGTTSSRALRGQTNELLLCGSQTARCPWMRRSSMPFGQNRIQTTQCAP